ncbi:MAG: hypothetical protein J6R30_00585 [Bacteroidales bacterium]|nr:hypothetical protein [Bacteroidales bacterium]
MRRSKDIKDDEIRIITASPTKKHNRLWIWPALITAVAGASICMLMLSRDKGVVEERAEMVFEPEVTIESAPELKWLGSYADTVKSYTEHLRDTINDIPLDIYIPHNAIPELMLGVPDIHDKSIVFTTQAADIRADNGKIVGAFVLKGKPLSWGLSKKGYCAIIDGKLTVGVADNSPLFEEATEKEGYFFRQYPLVAQNILVENEPKGKSIRKALCDRGGEIMVVMSQTPESFHDFSQALIDFKVNNAIYLVGSSSFGYFRDYYDQLEIIYNKFRYGYQYENFIVWKVPSQI